MVFCYSLSFGGNCKCDTIPKFLECSPGRWRVLAAGEGGFGMGVFLIKKSGHQNEEPVPHFPPGRTYPKLNK